MQMLIDLLFQDILVNRGVTTQGIAVREIADLLS